MNLNLVEIRECSRCRETLYVYEFDDRLEVVEAASRETHDCWQSDVEDADLLVIDDDWD